MKAWLTKDRCGDVYLFWNDKPQKDEAQGVWYGGLCYHEVNIYTIFHYLLDDFSPQWEDEEPTEVEIIIKTKET